MSVVKYLWRIPAQDPDGLTRGTVSHSNGEVDESLAASAEGFGGGPGLAPDDFRAGRVVLVRSVWRPLAVAAFQIDTDRYTTVKPVGRRDGQIDAVLYVALVTELAPTVEFFHGEPVTAEVVT